jgi:hypothetical protein
MINILDIFSNFNWQCCYCRSQWPRGLRRRSAAARSVNFCASAGWKVQYRLGSLKCDPKSFYCPFIYEGT